MKHNAKHRGIAAAMTAALLVTVCTGCGIKGGKGATLEVSFENSYSSEELKIEGTKRFDGAIALNDTNLFVVGSDENYEPTFYLYNMTDASTREISLAYLENLPKGQSAWPSSMVVDPQGGIGVIYYNYKDKDEDYEQLGYTVEFYDGDMNVVETKQLDIKDDINFNDVISLPDGGYLSSIWGDSGNYVGVLDEDFNLKKKINGSFSYIENMVVLPDGSIYISYQDMEYNSVFGKIDLESASVEKIEIEGLPSWFNECFASTTDDYTFYVTNSDAIYGINVSDGSCTEVVNWLNSDFMGDYVNSPIQLKDGRFLITAYDSDYQNSSMWLLSPRDPEELKNVEVISLATLYASQNLGNAVSQFNRANDKYRIVVYDYNKFNSEDDWEAGQKKFDSDLTSGIVADIICVNNISFESLCSKGLFYDLSDFAKDLPEDKYFTNFFKSLEYGGNLYRMGFSFNIETLVAKTKHVGEGTKSLTEFTELIKNLPEDMQPFGGDMTKDGALYNLVMSNINSFVDVNAGTCNFNSQEFMDLLEFCNTFPMEGKDYNNMDDSDWNNYWKEEDYKYINDKALFRRTWISDLKDEYRTQMQYFDTEPVTRTGYPVVDENDNGGRFSYDYLVSISSSSKYKEECWSFFEMMLSDEYQGKLDWSIPVSKTAFDTMAEKAMKPDTYMEDGKEVEMEFTVWRGDSEIKIPYMTQEYMDGLKAYISGITYSNYYDEQLSTIISEEAEMFFSGDQTAQQAADMIQSRAGLYLSEQH